jgi:hypothetical protein
MRVLFPVLSLFLICGICIGQAQDGVHGHIFRNNAIGFTYTFPEQFSPRVETEMPLQFQNDPTGREHMILALWETPERSGAPRMTFLYDTKVRQAGLSRAEMADRYLAAVRKLWVNVPGVKISGPKEISPAGYTIWRLDLFQPNTLPHYNAAVAIPLPDRRLLLIQANAPSQSELDRQIDSLSELHFDKK